MSSEERQAADHASGRVTPSDMAPDEMEQSREDEMARVLAQARKEKEEIAEALARQYAINKELELEAQRARSDEAANGPGRSSKDASPSENEDLKKQVKEMSLLMDQL